MAISMVELEFISSKSNTEGEQIEIYYEIRRMLL